MSLRLKLIAFCLAVSLVPLFIMGFYSVELASQSLSEQVLGQLEAVRDAKKETLGAMFQRWRAEAELYASTKEVYNAVVMLADYALGTPEGQRVDVQSDEYATNHDYVNPTFEPFVKGLGFEDALLIDDYGRVLYTYARNDDLGVDLAKGKELDGSNLQQAWKKAMQGEVVFVDFEPYPATGGKPASFVAAPIRNHNGNIAGVAALRIPLKSINEVMTQRSGLGSSGETYLVGPDKLMRSDSMKEAGVHNVVASFAQPKKGRMETEAVDAALKGESHTQLIGGLDNTRLLAAYTQIPYGTNSWALVAEKNSDEAFAPVYSLRWTALSIGVGTALLVVGISVFFFSRSVMRPIRVILDFLNEVTAGNLQALLQGDFKGELGQLAKGIRTMFSEVKNKLAFTQGILGGVNVPCLVLDTGGRVTYCNRQLLEMVSKTGLPEEYFGLQASAFFSSDADVSTNSIRAIEEQVPIQDECCIMTPDGRELCANISATPIYDLDDALMGAFTLYYDLTPIRTQERCITEQNEKIAQMACEAEDVANSVSRAALQLEDQVREALDGANEQSQRTMITAASVQELNAAMVQVAANADNVSRSANEAKQKAAEGEDIVRQAIGAIALVETHAQTLDKTMSELGEQAQEIGKIMGLIQDVADQTNLLALNAAIEAARAGEAGRGFAVVADEVRKLAERSMEATQDVGRAIQNIQLATKKSIDAGRSALSAVDESTRLAELSGNALTRIVEFVEYTADEVQSIAASSQEQSAAHDTISMAVEAINVISLETAEGMAKSSEALTELTDQAGKLREQIQQMRS